MSQITQFVEQLSDQHEFDISLYENDSFDKTPEILKSLDLSSFSRSSVVCDRLNMPYFGSVVNEERIQNLAIARNKALLADDMYLDADRVLFIDCDVAYDSDFIPRLLTACDYIGVDPDIVSGSSVTPRLHTDRAEKQAHILAKPSGLPKKAGMYRIYDTWATRRTPTEEWGSWVEGATDTQVAMVWTTYNSVCLYRAKPFKEGIRFGHFNRRIQRNDLEVAVVCEEFRQAGYNSVWMHQGLFCFHG